MTIDIMIAAGASLLGAGLLGAAMTKPDTSAAFNAVGMPAWAQNCWIAFTPEAYQELVSRVVADLSDQSLQKAAIDAVPVLYHDMEQAREQLTIDASIVSRTYFHTLNTDKYKALHRAIKESDTSVLNAGEKAFLRMLIDAYYTYLIIAQKARNPRLVYDTLSMNVSDLSKVTCLRNERIEELTRAVIHEYIKDHEETVRWNFRKYSVSSAEELKNKVTQNDSQACATRDKIAYEEVVEAQLDIIRLNDHLTKMRTQHTRPFVVLKRNT